MIHEAELEKDGKVAGDGHRDLSTKDEDGQEKETAAGPSGDSKAVYGAAEVLADVDTVLLEKKLVRKLDIRILPVIVLLYVLNVRDAEPRVTKDGLSSADTRNAHTCSIWTATISPPAVTVVSRVTYA